MIQKDRLKAIELGWSRGSGKEIRVPEVKEKKDEIVDINDEKNEEVIEVVTINESLDDEKLIAQKIISNHVKSVGGEENIINIRTLYNKVKMTSSVVINGKKTDSEMFMEHTFLSPNKYLTKMDMSGTTYYSLSLEGKTYNKTKENSDWNYLSYNDILKNQSSYVYEYSLLVNNEDVSYNGIENFNEVSCHVIKLPNYISNQDHDLYSLKMDIERTHYYNIETSLLVGTKTKSKILTDYKENSEYLKDSDVTTESLSIVSDYMKINNVLFPTKFTMINNSEQMKSTTIMKYLDIIINPELNKQDFKVKN